MTGALARVLVTGAQGFVGRWTTARLLAERQVERVVGVGRSERSDDRFRHEVSWLGRRTRAPMPDALRAALADPRYEYRRADIRDVEQTRAVLGELRPTAVLHLATQLRGDDLESLYSVNVLGAAAVLEALAAAQIRPARVVIGSTGGVYGRVEDEQLPIGEDTTRRPIDPYSASKAAAEDLSRIVAARHDLPVVFARIFNPVGPGLDERHLCASLARQFAELAAGALAIRVGPLDTSRDLVHVEDVSDALVALAERGAPGAAYNLGSGVETAMQQVFDHLSERSGRERVPAVRLERRRADIARHFAEVAAIGALGAAPGRSWTDAVDSMRHYYATTVAAAVGACGGASS